MFGCTDAFFFLIFSQKGTMEDEARQGEAGRMWSSVAPVSVQARLSRQGCPNTSEREVSLMESFLTKSPWQGHSEFTVHPGQV